MRHGSESVADGQHTCTETNSVFNEAFAVTMVCKKMNPLMLALTGNQVFLNGFNFTEATLVKV